MSAPKFAVFYTDDKGLAQMESEWPCRAGADRFVAFLHVHKQVVGEAYVREYHGECPW